MIGIMEAVVAMMFGILIGIIVGAIIVEDD